MNIPFVIDNQQYTMSEVLNILLAQHAGHSLDIATAYFNVGGWQLLHEKLGAMGSFCLLLGDEPEVCSDLGLREVGAHPIKGLIKDLANAGWLFRTFDDSRMCPFRVPLLGSVQDPLAQYLEAATTIHLPFQQL